MLIEILCLITLSSPLLWEIYDDWDADNHDVIKRPGERTSRNDDWILRGLLMLVAATVVFFIHPTKNYLQGFLMSLGIFVLFFPYAINIIHYYRGTISDPKWWNYLNKSSIPDKWPAWRGLHWSIRLIILSIFFAACVKLYVCWGQFISFYNEC